MKEQINLTNQTNSTATKLLETKGIDLYNVNKPVKISLEELLSKIEIMYDEKNDIINIKCNSNLLLESQNSIFISKNDTVFITGDVIGTKGKLFLNPVLQKFKQLKEFIKGNQYV